MYFQVKTWHHRLCKLLSWWCPWGSTVVLLNSPLLGAILPPHRHFYLLIRDCVPLVGVYCYYYKKKTKINFSVKIPPIVQQPISKHIMYATMIECIRTILSEYNNPAVWFISSSAQICEPPVNPSEARCFSGRFTKNQQPRENIHVVRQLGEWDCWPASGRSGPRVWNDQDHAAGCRRCYLVVDNIK